MHLSSERNIGRSKLGEVFPLHRLCLPRQLLAQARISILTFVVRMAKIWAMIPVWLARSPQETLYPFLPFHPIQRRGALSTPFLPRNHPRRQKLSRPSGVSNARTHKTHYRNLISTIRHFVVDNLILILRQAVRQLTHSHPLSHHPNILRQTPLSRRRTSTHPITMPTTSSRRLLYARTLASRRRVRSWRPRNSCLTPAQLVARVLSGRAL